MGRFYKLAQPDGFDFYTGKTINYRDNIGGTVCVPPISTSTKRQPNEPILCSENVIHASRKPLDCFVGAKIPCSAYLVKGNPVVEDSQKCGFFQLDILEEIEDKDELFGFNYTEACNPINPLLIESKPLEDYHKELLKQWASVRAPVRASVRASVWASVGDSVWASVWDSVGDSVWASVWDSVWDSVRDSVRASVGDSVWDSVGSSVGASVGASVLASVRASVWDSVWASVWDSVWDTVWESVRESVWASVGALFYLRRSQWKYTEKIKTKGYPFQCAVDLWKQGLVPSFDGTFWRLHSGKKAKVVFKISQKKLRRL